MFDFVLAGSDEFLEILVLVTCHGAITLSFKSQIFFKVCIQVFFESYVADKSHPAYAAVELNSSENLLLGHKWLSTVNVSDWKMEILTVGVIVGF